MNPGITTSSWGLGSSTGPLADQFDLALVDLDGVARRGDQPIPYATENLNQAQADGLHLVFVTNNAALTPEQVAAQLNKIGIKASAVNIMTAAMACAALLGTRLSPGDKVLVVGGDGMREAIVESGFSVIPSDTPNAADLDPKAVAMGYAPTVCWSDLAEAAYAVERGAWFVASNLDLSLPTPRGFAPGNGALVGAVQAATGVVPTSEGKPSPAMYELVVRRTGAQRPLVIGDRLNTDLGGARAAGFPGLLITTGVSTGRDAVLAKPTYRPDFIGADLRALFETHLAPEEGPDNWWVSGGRAARVEGNQLELDSRGPVGVDILRAACAAVWSAVDAGVEVASSSIPEFQL
ncbi:MAG: HAD-IIA family hydrolase [Promicromonosporaceae bacterium]|nr:HAD-IIA family hydrolase [Promicromonosporaceae bacterium]